MSCGAVQDSRACLPDAGKSEYSTPPSTPPFGGRDCCGCAAYFVSSRRQESVGVSVEMWQLHAKVTPYQLRRALVGGAALMTLTVLAAFGFYLDQRHDCGRFVCLFGRRFSINEFPTHGLHTHEAV
ncbi:uncharacterized protein Tco025E_09918 [Trypanosoma conorhini]|uniref:Uncharacterized protein n=1 Tax=Trypanosoma conorhini TaxID=83891 RepID=A0A422MR98_9TRYP|nr:uncharacterized protein Tco025E_09918 [Trypanosoma conorhini]RNE95752.1 hypothetical protein Tco025E_09918 [Trypanosoma conorhini]